MRGFLKAIASALASLGRVVWSKCKFTGKLIASIVPGLGGGGASQAYEDELDIEHTEQPAGLDHVRSLAAAIASGSVRPEQLETVDERTFTWLSVLDRTMIAKLLMANDETLRAHMRGTRGIKGVVPADTESVREYRRALERDSVQHDAERDYGVIPSGMIMA